LDRRKKVAAPKVPLKARTSPAIVPPTLDAPIRQNAPSTSALRANKMAEALAKDAMSSTTSAGGPEKVVLGGNSSRKGEVAEGAGDASKWKKRVDALFHLDTLQDKHATTYLPP
jgi:hypothetical protein